MVLPCFITSEHNYFAICFSSVKYISGSSDENKNNLFRKFAMWALCLVSFTTKMVLWWTPCHHAWSREGCEPWRGCCGAMSWAPPWWGQPRSKSYHDVLLLQDHLSFPLVTCKHVVEASLLPWEVRVVLSWYYEIWWKGEKLFTRIVVAVRKISCFLLESDPAIPQHCCSSQKWCENCKGLFCPLPLCPPVKSYHLLSQNFSVSFKC